MNRRKLTLGVFVAWTALSTDVSWAQQQTTIAIATGGVGGVYYPLGDGMAKVLTKYVPGWTATARVTGGSVENLRLIGWKQSEMAMVMMDAAHDALKGRGNFMGAPIDVRTLMVIYPDRMHVVSIEGKGINTLADLKGKRVSTGSLGSATEVMAFRVIEAAGLNKDKDIKREQLGIAESTNALKDGKIDAYFWAGGLPTAGVTALATTFGIKIKLIDHSHVIDKMNAKYFGVYSPDLIPARTYPGQDKDNSVTSVQTILVANASMPDQVAYAIVKTLIERKDDLVAVDREAKNISLAMQIKGNSVIPWHPGAVKYFTERGTR